MKALILLALLGAVQIGGVTSRAWKSREQAYVISSAEGIAASSYVAKERRARSDGTGITSFRVKSVVMSRFSQVNVVADMKNDEKSAKEMVFSVRLPEAAFITEFTMLVGDVTFVGKIKGKKIAEEQYQKAVESGNSAGLVTADVRETQTFDVAANVPAGSTVTFNLVYQQLLKRRFGSYDHVILVNPGQVVDEFVIEVYVTENTGITTLSAISAQKGFGTRDKESRGFDENGEVPVETYVRRSQKQAKVTFKPTAAQQRRLLMVPEDDRKFTVRYDVTRESIGGEIQMRNGYFVHFFAPETLPVIPKNVVFVIDRSGSMGGQKMDQTKAAFASVIKELGEADNFNIVTFSSGVQVWNNESLVPANERNIADAIKTVEDIRATGSTNFNEAVLVGARMFSHVDMDDTASSVMIVLTDGVPTYGVRDTTTIRQNLRNEVEGRFSVFCLGFGSDINKDLLRLIGNDNKGLFRQIYEDSDADLQMKNFFQEVASPLLLHIKMKYKGKGVEDLSKSRFEKYFKGSEVVVVGKAKSEALEVEISGTSLTGEVSYEVSGSEIDQDFQHWFNKTGDFSNFIERLWAYFTIRDLLEKEKITTTQTEKKSINDRIMEMSLKYSFVTPLTSMVVTLPEDEITTTLSPKPSPPWPPLPPPCYHRGVDKPAISRHSIIWCPYIRPSGSKPPSIPGQFGRPGQPSFGGFGGYFALSYPPPASYGFAPASGETGYPQLDGFASPDGSASRFLGIGPSLTFYGGFDDRRQQNNIPVPKNNSCSRASITRDVTLKTPSVKRPSECKFSIAFSKGSWIDVQVKYLNTTKNKVLIRSQGAEILKHVGGYSEPKRLTIFHHSVDVSFTIYPTDAIRKNIKISFSEFVPRSNVVKTPAPALPPSTPPTCGEDIYSSQGLSGSIASPNYPRAYPSNSYCVWNIVNESVDDFVLQLAFDDMDVEIDGESKCSHDRIVVFAGGSERVMCGYNATDVIRSEAGSTRLLFYSDENLETRGFQATFAFLPK